MHSQQFSKKFPLLKNGGHFEFLAKHELASISLTTIFKKFFPPQKWRPFGIFEFFPKMAKHKIASISLTVRDRAISSKFSPHRVSENCTLGVLFLVVNQYDFIGQILL